MMARNDQDLWGSSEQGPSRTDQVPRWLVLLGVSIGIALTTVLLRYAIDLLGIVFVIVVVGFFIRALADWLTDAESVSFWSIVAVCAGVLGTVFVGAWLFGSRATRDGRVNIVLPPFMSETIAWAESNGWGHRVILTHPEAERPAGRERGAPRATVPFTTDRDRDTSPRASGTSGFDPTGRVSPAPVNTASTPVPGSSRLTSTTLTVTPANRVAAGRPLQLTAVVQTGDSRDVPDGTVVFWRDGVVLGSGKLRAIDGRAVAQLTAQDLSVGEIGLSAEYVGTGRFRTSRSSVVQQQVVAP
jgi:hypothetical protein